VISSLDDFLSRHRSQAKECPNFAAQDYLGDDVSAEKKQEMTDRMADRIGYLA